ncbi:UDP-glucuronosyltransferase 1-7C [Folsomia candida]|uniref:UDP-glucuronosyltransferase 1-7C n=1 Tax=Folsomia candida TaxID=158441 RepID=UPI000B904FF7|nr:UDP-glucuronosyltransferase 1-7C [Folsomia candida]
MHFKLPLVLIILIGTTLNVSHGVNIMFFFGLSSYSHRIIAWPLVESLAARGHNVTFVSPFPSKSPNPAGVTDYVPKSMVPWLVFDEKAPFFKDRVAGRIEWNWFTLLDHGINLCTTIFNDTNFVDFVKNTKFDMVVVDALANECAYGWTYLHGSKLVLFNTANPFPWYVDTIGFPDEASWIPDQTFHPSPPASLSFLGRIQGVFTPMYYTFLRENFYFPALEKIFREKLAPDFPSASDFEKSTSLVLANTHYGEDFARPLPPNVVSVGGMHCAEKTKPLPKEISDFLSTPSGEKDEGFIYMSFGSCVEIANFPPHIQNEIVNTLRKLRNIKILWKIDIAEPLKDLPAHIYTAKWMPQQDILAHPKIRAFITHGGLLGIQEAICNGVPLIAFPVFAEQDYNANKLEWRKVGVQLEITTITEDKFTTAIRRVLDDKEFSTNMKRLSTIFRDRPARPVDTAVWWTEYALRHDNATHLRPQSVHLPWWKKRQLDIWGSIFLAILFTYKLICFLLKAIFKLFCGSSSGKDKKKSKLKSS